MKITTVGSQIMLLNTLYILNMASNQTKLLKYLVEGGHRAIIFSRLGGVKSETFSEGLHLRVPWLQYPIIYDIRSRPRKISSPTGSKDLQMVNITLRVLSRPDADYLPDVFK